MTDQLQRAPIKLSAIASCLDAQRNHVLGILADLDDTALRTPMLASGWSCLDLLNHLAIDVERFWFGAVVAADPAVIEELDTTPNTWRVGADVSAESVIAHYRQEIDSANATIAATALDAAPRWWPTADFGDWRLADLEEILLHVIAETACHAGHLDAARELIDGRQWMVLT